MKPQTLLAIFAFALPTTFGWCPGPCCPSAKQVASSCFLIAPTCCDGKTPCQPSIQRSNNLAIESVVMPRSNPVVLATFPLPAVSLSTLLGLADLHVPRPRQASPTLLPQLRI